MPNVFKMEFINDIDQDFKLSKLANPEEENKTTAPMSNATTTEQVNEKTARSALPDLSKVVINLPAGINILTAIEKIVFKSTFLTAALKNVTVSQFENDPKTDAPEEIPNKGDGAKVVRWYNVTPQVKVLGLNTTRTDWAYEITYVVSPYETQIGRAHV